MGSLLHQRGARRTDSRSPCPLSCWGRGTSWFLRWGEGRECARGEAGSMAWGSVSPLVVLCAGGMGSTLLCSGHPAFVFCSSEWQLEVFGLFVICPNCTCTRFPGDSSGKEPACLCKRHKRLGFDPWVRKIPGGGHGNPLQFSCLDKPHGQKSLLGYNP